jgi:hypothetical protein
MRQSMADMPMLALITVWWSIHRRPEEVPVPRLKIVTGSLAFNHSRENMLCLALPITSGYCVSPPEGC